MNKFSIRILAALAIVTIMASCKKDYPSSSGRKFRFQLYTNQDFSDNTSLINFSVFIRTANRTIFDSTLAPMQIKDIPDAANKLIFEKTVTGNDNVDLAAGFRYEIQDVGISWYIDTSKAGNPLKIIDFAFQ
ncbi:MAG TPA: hypothetical protein VGQ09_12565 [Chitinophagaceae bacterium]|jgi:hypothetical protein|nr:hypothetical protein [Chitinophagaceae bacterium]